jgi:hypothetical protein
VYKLSSSSMSQPPDNHTTTSVLISLCVEK